MFVVFLVKRKAAIKGGTGGAFKGDLNLQKRLEFYNDSPDFFELALRQNCRFAA